MDQPHWLHCTLQIGMVQILSSVGKAKQGIKTSYVEKTNQRFSQIQAGSSQSATNVNVLYPEKKYLLIYLNNLTNCMMLLNHLAQCLEYSRHLTSHSVIVIMQYFNFFCVCPVQHYSIFIEIGQSIRSLKMHSNTDLTC